MSDITPSDILLRVTGKPRYGVITRRLSTIARGGEQLQETFSRADATTCATFVGKDGKLYTAAANKPRIQWVDLDGDGIFETPGLLLEGSRVNSCLQSETLDNASWTKGSSSVTANAVTAPDGTVTMDKLVEAAAGPTTHQASQPITITSGQTVTISCWAKIGERTKFDLELRDSTETNAFGADFDANAGTFVGNRTGGAGAVQHKMVEAFPGGLYRIKVTGQINGGITAAFVMLRLHDASNNISYTGDGTSGMYFWGVQVELGNAFASSYIKTVAATVTRAADSLTVPVPFGVQNLTVFASMARPVWADASGDIGLPPGVFQIATAGIPNVRGGGVQASRLWYGYIDTTGADSNFSTAIPAGALQQVSWQFKNLTTAGQVAADVGAGLGTFASAATGFSAFGNQTLRVGAANAGQELYGVVLDLFVVNGLHTLAECQAVP